MPVLAPADPRPLPERFLPALAWVLPSTFLAAIASWFLIEKPAIALSGRALVRRPTAREVRVRRALDG